jgi:hypothetical protein
MMHTPAWPAESARPAALLQLQWACRKAKRVGYLPKAKERRRLETRKSSVQSRNFRLDVRIVGMCLKTGLDLTPCFESRFKTRVPRSDRAEM